MSCRRCCGCNNCGCNGCGCNGCGNNSRRGCRCLANDVQKIINDLIEDVKDLDDAFDELRDEGCIRNDNDNNNNNNNNNNNGGCNGCGCGCHCGCRCHRGCGCHRC